MKPLTIICNDLFPTEQSVIRFNQKFDMVDAEEEVDNILDSMTSLDVLVEIQDDFGSDCIIQLPNGHIILTERNGGGHTMSSKPINKKDLLDYVS